MRPAPLATGLAIALAAVPALAADAEGGGGLFYPFLNFALLLAVLIYFARKPIQRFFRDRHDEVRSALEQAAELCEQAEARHVEWQRRLADLDAELEQIRAAARQRTEAERERILADARAAAERIRRDARAAVEQELRHAREELRQEAADLAIELAADRLRAQVTDADRSRLLDEFIARVEQGERS